jgi:hypothetical protein
MLGANFFWVKKLQKETSLFLKGIFCSKYFFVKTFEMNHKLKFEENINIIIIITNYNLKRPLKICPHNSLKLYRDSCHLTCIKIFLKNN